MRIEIRNITIDLAENWLQIDKHAIHYLGNLGIINKIKLRKYTI